MSIASNRSLGLNRRLNSSKSTGRNRAYSRAQQSTVSHDDAYTFALRIAFLHYLLQPRAKRKQYVTAPKPAHRSQTSVATMMGEFASLSSSSAKLPHNFRSHLEKRVQGVIMNTERMPGYSDAAVKRSFAEAYTAFTEKNFQKALDKDRKIEPLILIFYSSASKAAQKGRAPDDDAWKLLPDRHVAMFVRLVSAIIRDTGHDRERPELAARLATLEKKLLTNDQDLADHGQEGTTTVEVIVPLSYDVKDMPMVQSVARIFGITNSQVQSDIDAHKPNWTEEAALRDLKSYQHRLNSNMSGALRASDFDLDESFQEWKKSEAPHLSQMLLDILTAKPELAKASSSPNDKPLPGRPQSIYSEDQAYADLGRLVTSSDSSAFGDWSLSTLSIDESSSIRAVDEVNYTFIPQDPRALYKAILQCAMTFDQINSDPSAPYTPLSKQSMDLLTELCVHWRLPQFTRLIVFVEVATRRFFDSEISVEELDTAFDFAKNPQPELKKAPHITNYTAGLSSIDPIRWTEQDTTAYKETLGALHDALLRDLYDLLLRSYEAKPPPIGPAMHVLETHTLGDPLFSWRKDSAEEYAELLADGLKKEAAEVYRTYLDAELPASQEEWEFGHIVKLGQKVVKLCERIKKRYRNNPELLGVNPLTVLVETMFPNFEQDANAVIQRILVVADDKGEEINIQDGFDLYKEMVEIRGIHRDSLPGTEFAFDIEGVLVSFVWRWLRSTEAKIEGLVDEAVKQDQFQIRVENPENPEQVVTDAQRHSVSIIDLFMLFNQTADQIFQLEWDNDVHHAQFITALAKMFSVGIGRYCEIVDQRFAKEMDRPTVQEIAAANRTTQEKFFQYAKDAFNTKEKMEPFQFYPESFVKLNNIEYAMQELDKLEKTVNVDACVEVLKKIEGSKPQTRKSNKYVFTIKIIEAEDIKACDPNGYSDPYVVLCDEFQKRLAKTRIVYKNLNPRWDESVDITVQGALNIIATIWDYDTFGEHDFVGRTSLKLDPVYFGDYLPREYWLDLDTQGRLLLRVSMEGERDDIQFHFGKAFRILKRTERDMVRKITDKLVSQINAMLSIDNLRNLLRGGVTSSVTSYFKRGSTVPATTQNEVVSALQGLFDYFDANFAIMKETLTGATMLHVFTRLWKEVLMAIENLLVPPLSDKPSTQKPLYPREMDVVYQWLQLLFDFFNAKDDAGQELGVPANVLKSPKYHELASLNFFYFEDTNNLIRESERIAAAAAQRAQLALSQPSAGSRLSAPAALGPMGVHAAAFGSLGTIRRGKSIMMSRNLGTMRRAKEEKRKEAQADPSDDMILRILRMRPEAAGYLKERNRQKERQAAAAAAALIVKNSVSQGWGAGAAAQGAFGRNNLPRR